MKLKDPLLLREQCFIDGGWMAADAGGTLAVRNPATAETLGVIPNMGAGEARRAIEAAARALPAWAVRTAKERAAILRRWFDLMLEHQDDLAVLMTAEQGKPLAESKGEISYAASFIEWFAEEGKRLYGDVIPGHQADKRILVLRQPVGVVAAITPWNFPSAMITRKAGPALAAGCTMVLKPATQTPYSALALAELGARAGIPQGVFNVITGSAAAIGGEMTANPTVRKVTFTGSTEVGKKLMAQCAGTLKKLSLELGGNAPFIVFDDADLDAAVQGAIASKYRNTGQTCVCANRLLVKSLRKGYYGASIMPVEVMREMASRMPDVRLWNLYGQTEIAPLATMLGPDDQLRKPGSCGRPVLNVETRVVDEKMRDVKPGEVGEIVHRSPLLMTGYYKDEEKTRRRRSAAAGSILAISRPSTMRATSASSTARRT